LIQERDIEVDPMRIAGRDLSAIIRGALTRVALEVRDAGVD
jgi:hypothetical protein